MRIRLICSSNSLEVLVSPIILWVSEYQILLLTADAAFFIVSNVENILTITLASPLSEDNVNGRRYFRTEVTATNSLNSRVPISILFVDIEQPPVNPNPKFTHPTFRGSLDIDLELTFEEVVLEEATYGDDVVFTLDGGK